MFSLLHDVAAFIKSMEVSRRLTSISKGEIVHFFQRVTED